MTKNLPRCVVAALLSLSTSLPLSAAVKMQIFAHRDRTVPAFECLLVQGDLPRLTFEKGKVLKVQGSAADVTFEDLLDVDDIQFIVYDSHILVGMEELDNSLAPCPRLSYLDNETVRVDGLDADDHLLLFSVDGKLLPGRMSRHSQGFSLSLHGLPAGIYVIRSKEHSFKIYKKL